MSTDLDTGRWSASPRSYSFIATVAFWTAVEIVAVLTALEVWQRVNP
jgi:hypothetical protein